MPGFFLGGSCYTLEQLLRLVRGSEYDPSKGRLLASEESTGGGGSRWPARVRKLLLRQYAALWLPEAGPGASVPIRHAGQKKSRPQA